MSKKHQQPESGVESSEETSRPRLGVPTALAICTTGWFLPGASHLLLGRWGRAILFCVSVLIMFGLGLAMDGRLYELPPEQPLHLFAFFANVGVGLPYVIARNMGSGVGILSSPSYDYGSTYLWVSGLLNYLIVLDAFDIARCRKP